MINCIKNMIFVEEMLKYFIREMNLMITTQWFSSGSVSVIACSWNVKFLIMELFLKFDFFSKDVGTSAL